VFQNAGEYAMFATKLSRHSKFLPDKLASRKIQLSTTASSKLRALHVVMYIP